jgi:hypothetical protein
METFEVLKVVETVKVLFENHTRSSNIEKNCTAASACPHKKFLFV